MLAYLSRYTHRVAIANSRLIACDGNGVTFKWKDYRAEGRDRQKIMTLATDEFIRRFLIHVLPHGFHRIRHYGLFASGTRADNIARARELLAVPAAHPKQPRHADAAVDQPASCASVPMLRRSHDHHRDLRARLQRHAIGRRLQPPPSGSTPHDRAHNPANSARSRSPALDRPRQQLARYPAIRRKSSDNLTRSRHPAAHREQPLNRAPTRCDRLERHSTHLIRGAQIPIAHAAPPTYPSRGFLPWRFSDAGRPCARRTVSGRHPKTFTLAVIASFLPGRSRNLPAGDQLGHILKADLSIVQKTSFGEDTQLDGIG